MEPAVSLTRMACVRPEKVRETESVTVAGSVGVDWGQEGGVDELVS